jgi:hypothetical protein
MQVEPSTVAGVELIGPDTAAFEDAVRLLLGREPDAVLKFALPYSLITRNDSSRAVALLGIRFNMVGPQAKKYSVTHYADMLRHSEKAAITPGAVRFVCAEPLYTDMVFRRAREIDARGPMNLRTLRTMLQVSASIDCVAFDDGQFAGPDSLRAFDRLEIERDAEIAFVREILVGEFPVESRLKSAMEIPPEQAGNRALLARRVLAKRLFTAFEGGGPEAVAIHARNHKARIALWR